MEKIDANEMAVKMFRILLVGAILFMLSVILFVL